MCEFFSCGVIKDIKENKIESSAIEFNIIFCDFLCVGRTLKVQLVTEDIVLILFIRLSLRRLNMSACCLDIAFLVQASTALSVATGAISVADLALVAQRPDLT